MLDHFLREDLKLKAARPMAILNPLKVVITNYPEGEIEYLDVLNNVENEELGSRKIAFSRNLYIEKEDFVPQKPNKHWKRLAKDIEVRLFGAYFIKCNEIIYDGDEIKEIHCTYDPQTKSGSGFNERKPNGTIHYVEASTAMAAQFNLFEPLILDDPDTEKSFIDKLNPTSWKKVYGYVEESLKDTLAGTHYQFLRNGYFTTDLDSTKDNLIFNRTVELKSTFK